MKQEKFRCVHLERRELAKHSTLTLRTVDASENTTSYEWDVRMELCVGCSGFMRGALVSAPLSALAGKATHVGPDDFDPHRA